MDIYRIAIITGQLGRIWTLNNFRRKVYSSMAALGYFAIMMEMYGRAQRTEQDLTFNLGAGKVSIIPKKQNTYKFKKRPF